MNEAMLSAVYKTGANDNSDIPFPAGTPFKGITRSSDFVYGDALAGLVGLATGGPINIDSGWLHFVETNGLELFIAKKPVRYAATYEAIASATGNGTKEITIRGEVYICRLMTGAISTSAAAVPSNAGGEWNRYMYAIYDNSDRVGIETAPIWGNYTRTMLGLGAPGGTDLGDGVFTICDETLTNGYCLRGNDWQNSSGNHPIMGIWNMPANNPQTYYGWRPVLVKKSSLPPSVYRGLVAGSTFITPSALSTLVNYSFGTLMDDATPWMHFVEDNGKEVYVAQKSLRDKCTRTSLNTAGLGNTANGKLVTIGGKNYKCRLLTEAEWNRYMYGVYNNAVVNVNTLKWASFSPAELTVCSGGVVAGGLTHTYDGTTRGYPNISGAWGTNDGAPGTSGYGWRPVLELVP